MFRFNYWTQLYARRPNHTGKHNNNDRSRFASRLTQRLLGNLPRPPPRKSSLFRTHTHVSRSPRRTMDVRVPIPVLGTTMPAGSRISSYARHMTNARYAFVCAAHDGGRETRLQNAHHNDRRERVEKIFYFTGIVRRVPRCIVQRHNGVTGASSASEFFSFFLFSPVPSPARTFPIHTGARDDDDAK